MENNRGESPQGKKGTSPSRLREFFSDWRYLKVSFYVAFTAALLYILYFSIKNIDTVADTVGGVLGSILSALSPLIIGLILAYLISPLVELVDRQLISRIWSKLPSNAVKREKRIHFRRTVSIILTFVMIIFAAFLIIYAFAFLIVGRLFFDSVSGMLESIAFYFSQYEQAFREFMTKLPDSGLEEQVENLFNDVALWVSDHFSASGVIRAVTGIGISLMNTVLGIVVAIYLIKDKDFFQGLWRNFLDSVTSRKLAQSVGATLNDVDKVFSRFLRGQLLDALIVAILASVVLTIIGLDFAVLLGCFAGLTNMIPYFGAVFGAIPAVLVALLTGGVTKGLITIAAFVVIQQIDANIIYPRVVGSSTGLHPVFVLLSVTFAGYFWGIIGMVLAVPVAGCIKLILVRKAAARQAKSLGSIRQ
jgi:predicted PurR-regulated permease PerM